MSVSVRVAAAVVMAGAIAAAIALPAIVGGNGHAHVVGAPETAGRQTVRIHGLATPSGPAARPRQHRPAHGAQRRRPAVESRVALAAVGIRRLSTPRPVEIGGPAAPQPRPPLPGGTPPPTRSPSPAPQPPAAPPTPSEPAPRPSPQPPAPVVQVQSRELASTPKPASAPAPSPAPVPVPNPEPKPLPQPSPPPVPTPGDHGSPDDRVARHQDERARDDGSAAKRDHDSARDG